MQVVYVYDGNPILDYGKFSLVQLRRYNPDIPIYFVGSSRHLQERAGWWSKYGVKTINSEEFSTCKILKEYEKASWLSAWDVKTLYPSPADFVHQTSRRVFLLNEVLYELGLTDTIHIELDVMIYSDLLHQINICKKMYDRAAVCSVGPDYVCFGICYLPLYYSLNEFCEFYLDLLQMGDKEIKRLYPSIDFVQEMTIGSVFSGFDFLPSLPTDKHYTEFQSLWDGASAGQNLFGTNSAHHPKGYMAPHHYVGQQLLAGRCRFDFNGGRPIMLWGSEKILMNNLHIHSKMTEQCLTPI